MGKQGAVAILVILDPRKPLQGTVSKNIWWQAVRRNRFVAKSIAPGRVDLLNICKNWLVKMPLQIVCDGFLVKVGGDKPLAAALPSFFDHGALGFAGNINERIQHYDVEALRARKHGEFGSR